MSAPAAPLESHLISRGRELALVLVMFLLVGGATLLWQKRLTANGGEGFDGVFYCQVARQLAGWQRPQSAAPWVYRAGTPALAALVAKDDVVRGFEYVNLAASLLATLLLLRWLRLFLDDWRIRVLLLVLFLTQWLGPLRQTPHYPALSDPMALVAVLALLLLYEQARHSRSALLWFAISAAAAVGVLFRETVWLLPVSMLASDAVGLRWSSGRVQVHGRALLRYLLPVVCGGIALVAVHLWARNTSTYTYARAALHALHEHSPVQYLHAWFVAFGPILVLPIYNWRGTLAFLRRHQDLLAFFAGAALLAWIGGDDTERFAYFTLPVVYLLIGLAISHLQPLLRSPAIATVLVVCQAFAQRLFWTLPDFPGPDMHIHRLPLFAPLGSHFSYLDLWTFYAEPQIERAGALEYIVFAVVLLFWLRYRASKSPLPAPSAARESC